MKVPHKFNEIEKLSGDDRRHARKIRSFPYIEKRQIYAGLIDHFCTIKMERVLHISGPYWETLNTQPILSV